jgi:hypothetical protein
LAEPLGEHTGMVNGWIIRFVLGARLGQLLVEVTVLSQMLDEIAEASVNRWLPDSRATAGCVPPGPVRPEPAALQKLVPVCEQLVDELALSLFGHASS